MTEKTFNFAVGQRYRTFSGHSVKCVVAEHPWYIFEPVGHFRFCYRRDGRLANDGAFSHSLATGLELVSLEPEHARDRLTIYIVRTQDGKWYATENGQHAMDVAERQGTRKVIYHAVDLEVE